MPYALILLLYRNSGDIHVGRQVHQDSKPVSAHVPETDVGARNITEKRDYEEDDEEADYGESSSSSLSITWDTYMNETNNQSRDLSEELNNDTEIGLKTNEADVVENTVDMSKKPNSNHDDIKHDDDHDDDTDDAGDDFNQKTVNISKLPTPIWHNNATMYQFNQNSQSHMYKHNKTAFRLKSDPLTRTSNISSPILAKAKNELSFKLHEQERVSQQIKHKHCTPKKNIVFLKTHKCATSTVQNIFFRYGDTHQLSFVLPKSTRDHRFSMKEPFNRRQVFFSGRNPAYFNIFTNHAIFNQRGKYNNHLELLIFIIERAALVDSIPSCYTNQVYC